MNRLLIAGGVVAAALILLLLNSVFIVPQGKQAIVLQLGEAVAVINSETSKEKEGLHFKAPLTQSVIFYDRRNQGYDLPQQEVTAADQQRLIVDAVARYRIRDPLQFFRSAQTPENGEQQLRQRLIAALLGELGKVRQPDIVSGQRVQVMQRIRQTLNTQMTGFGIDIIDVRIRRADLPEQNSERVYERMKAELGQKATQYRAEGDREALTITSEADKTVAVTKAEAYEKAQKIRGEGDAERNAIYAAAYNKDPEFFAFSRSMQAYENSIKEGTPVVISPDSDFFRYFGKMGGSGK